MFATAASALAGRPALVGWLLELQQTGLLRRLAGPDAADGQALLQRALRVLGELPATDVLLPELAAVVDGDAHALDMDAPLGRLVVRGAAALMASLRAQRDDALLYRRLATLRTDVPIDANLATLAWRGPDRPALAAVCARLEITPPDL